MIEYVELFASAAGMGAGAALLFWFTGWGISQVVRLFRKIIR